MTTTEIITLFELVVDDITELSTSEETALANRIYNRVCLSKVWEFLKTSATGTMSSDATSSYITIPSDFAFFVENNQYTDNSIGINNNASPKVIFIGTAHTPYQIINFSDRRQYLNQRGYAYLDVANSKIRFTATPESTTYEFDYAKVPTALTSGTSPLFPSRFHEMISYGMASENDVLQLSDKAKSYRQENEARFNSYLQDMKYWDSMLQLN